MTDSNPESLPDKNAARSACWKQGKDHWNAPIDEYGEAYFQILVAEYRTLATAAEPPAAAAPAAGGDCCQPKPCDRRKAAAAVIEKLIGPETAVIKWRDLLLLEAMLAKMQTKEAISFELTLLRAEYKEMVGIEAYDALKLPMVPLPATDADYPRALAEYETLLQEIHWNYLSAPAREEERTKLLVAISQSLLLLAALVFALWFVFDSRVLATVALFGGLGAWLSAFRRAQSPALSSMVLLNLRRSPWSRLSYSLAPWIGGVSAIALAFIFAGGGVSGRFFPTVRWTDQLDPVSTNALRGTVLTNKPATNLLVISLSPAVIGNSAALAQALSVSNALILSNALALSNAPGAPMQWHEESRNERWWFGADTEHALLLVWAFLAGFSERLVPDLLNRIAKKTEGAA
jgi:hypothetical protein